MNCAETRRLLDANLDRELDLVRHLELEEHLRACPACANLAENARARQAALRESLPRFTAPPAVAEKIRAALRTEMPVAPSAVAAAAAPHRAKIIFPVWQVAGLAASVTLALLAGYTSGSAHARRDALFAEAIGDHVRSLQATHLFDVASTDQHTVKPWFVGKLDFSPPVVDLAAVGFPLAGGRLEHVDGRAAAALVFHRRQHVINLFIWPVTGTPHASHTAQRDGYEATAWSQSGMNFLAVSEIPARELADFADAFRNATR